VARMTTGWKCYAASVIGITQYVPGGRVPQPELHGASARWSLTPVTRGDDHTVAMQ
jgi:hypothetical protein